MSRIVLWLILIISFSMTSSFFVYQAYLLENQNPRLEESIRTARISQFKAHCTRWYNEDRNTFEYDFDVPALCSCLAEANVEINHNLENEDDRFEEYSSKTEHCYNDYYRDTVLKSCKLYSQNIIRWYGRYGRYINCNCIYEKSKEELVKAWIFNRNNKDGLKYKNYYDDFQQSIEVCIVWK